MNLWREVVENNHIVAFLEKLECEIRAYETGSTGNQNLFIHYEAFYDVSI